jgi:hypothetical protein
MPSSRKTPSGGKRIDRSTRRRSAELVDELMGIGD